MVLSLLVENRAKQSTPESSFLVSRNEEEEAGPLASLCSEHFLSRTGARAVTIGAAAQEAPSSTESAVSSVDEYGPPLFLLF